MSSAVLGEQIEAAKQRLRAAERELASEIQALSVASGGETTFVTKLLEVGFRKLKEAQHQLAELKSRLHLCEITLHKRRA
jgi:hypothetical protein